MNVFGKLSAWFVFCIALLQVGMAQGQPQEVPEALQAWQDWATWDVKHRDCPTPYNSATEHICFWPSSLSLSADQKSGSWQVTLTVFAETWVPLPRSADIWPTNVRAGDQLVPVVERQGKPAVHLPAGVHQLSGTLAWEEMPQRIAIPKEIGILSLVVEGQPVPMPKWDASGNVWLKRLRAEPADKNQLTAKVYRVVEDGIPVWLRTDIELTVSGKSREEQLGWILPEGWKLSLVESPIPVAVNDRGLVKAQVRAGTWTVSIHAFRATDVKQVQFAEKTPPISPFELVAFRAKPEFRIAEFAGIQAVDVTQTTFPEKWRDLPVYQWKTDAPFQLVEKMRGMGLQRPEGLRIDRHFWLDEDGHGFTYRDHFSAGMQQTWRLDVAEGQQLGAVRIDGEGQLITANPKTGAHGVEIRNRNLNMEAIGRVDEIDAQSELSATGWQTDADSLEMTLTLPPGWRVFAMLGADRVEGDWLTAWSLLDLFLLLIFTLAVFRLWGVKAAVVAFLAFGLAYHEPSSPRLTWFFLLIPLALLRVVPEGPIKTWITVWKNGALVLILLALVPFVAKQIESVIHPQLEQPGTTYGNRRFLGWTNSYQYRDSDALTFTAESQQEVELFDWSSSMKSTPRRGKAVLGPLQGKQDNMAYDAKARIQTGPAEPEWGWNQVRCYWNGPVTADQQIRPVLISLRTHRILTVVRVVFLLALAMMLAGGRGIRIPFKRKGVATTAAAAVLALLFLPQQASAQIPDQEMLNTLRERLLEPSDAYPHAAEIPAVDLKIEENKVSIQIEIHAAIGVAVPLPGRLPAWSPLSVKIDDQDALVRRHDGYLWANVPQGVHTVTVEGLLPESTEWEWTFLLKPRRVAIDAPTWNVTGVRPNGVPEQQVFFSRKQKATAGEAAYDQKVFRAIVSVDRHLEVGLNWKVRNVVTRLSSPGKAVSLKIPLLAGERVLTSNVVVEDGAAEVRLGAGQTQLEWESELPRGNDIQLTAKQTEDWVERWHLVTSPVWNAALSGLSPVYEANQQHLIPVWHPWPGESATLSFSRPEAISGDTITVQKVNHEVSLGDRQRTTDLQLFLESSLGSDFVLDIDPEAKISSLKIDDRAIPVRREGAKLFVPVRPGRQTVQITWRTDELMDRVVRAGKIQLPVEGSNVTTVMHVPVSRWVLWAEGPLRGPAVRFWTILVVAILVALALGSISISPLGRIEWILLMIGLTQVHLVAALIVVAWLFLLAWRGQKDLQQVSTSEFNLIQTAIVPITLLALAILVAVVGEGLLGSPEMFIVGNGSSRTYLNWYQPRVGLELPEPSIVSISVWFYRLLMLFWALWLAAALLRWLKWGWSQYSHGGYWKSDVRKPPVAQLVTAEVVPDAEKRTPDENT